MGNDSVYGHRRISLELNVDKKKESEKRLGSMVLIPPYKRRARWTKRRDERRPESKYQNLIKGLCPVKMGKFGGCKSQYQRSPIPRRMHIISPFTTTLKQI